MSKKTAYKQVTLVLLCVLLLFFRTSSYAANQGTVAAASTGSLDILVTASLYIVLFGLNDINLGTWSGNGDIAGDDVICIARNSDTNGGVSPNGPDVGYAVTVSGSGNGVSASAFGLSNGTDFINYNAYYNDRRWLGGRVQLSSGSVLTAQSSKARDNYANVLNWINNSGCVFRTVNGISSGPNGNISIVIPEAELRKVVAGSYLGTLTITVQPL